jgi:hypothetical protein
MAENETISFHSDAKADRLRVIQGKTEEAAQYITALPADQWWQGVAYLLEVLDREAQERGVGEVYAGVLDRLWRDIKTRIELGHW